MDAAKNAVKDFMHQDGKHTTNVHETMAPAVTKGTQHQHHHEHTQQAVDREIHQDHHHTTVIPVTERQRLDEQHHHRLAGVETRKFEHGNDEDVRRKLDVESAKYVDTHEKGETRHTTSAAPVVTGEHVHHHVHEKLQPVVHREIIEPHVTHTVVPVKEQHHNAAAHHSATTLPAVSMQEFKKTGGVLGGREERSDFFEGEPRHMGGVHAPHRPEDAANEFRKTGHTDTHGHLTGRHNAGTGSGATGLGGATTGTHHHGTSGSGLTGSNSTGTGLTGSSTSGAGAGTGLTGSNATGTSSGLTGANSTRSGGVTGGSTTDHGRTDSTGVAQDATTTTKPSLLSRLNPLKDSDGDGKKGIMD